MYSPQEKRKLLIYDDHKSRNSYVASDLVDFFRNKLVDNNSDFSFETVMSDTNKIEFLKKAKNLGYYNYLYFFCTDDVEININRVQIRVKQNGHNVDPGLIKSRYEKSLRNIKPGLKFVHRAYFFDNSNETSKLVAEFYNDEITVIDNQMVPNWFIDYVFN